ncbi:MAG: hypothetical protein H6727_12905 [Myxococcales bacterium]|nr:hypothetical protein [Myxococcales bacterium]
MRPIIGSVVGFVSAFFLVMLGTLGLMALELVPTPWFHGASNLSAFWKSGGADLLIWLCLGLGALVGAAFGYQRERYPFSGATTEGRL